MKFLKSSCLLLVAVLLLLNPSSAGAKEQPSTIALTVTTLTDNQVAATIDNATHGKRHQIGLILSDVQTALLSTLICNTCAVSGCTNVVFTPVEYIEYLTMEARKEMKPFSAADVSPEMQEPLFRVFATPSTADYLNGAGLSRSEEHTSELQSLRH